MQKYTFDSKKQLLKHFFSKKIQKNFTHQAQFTHK